MQLWSITVVDGMSDLRCPGPGEVSDEKQPLLTPEVCLASNAFHSYPSSDQKSYPRLILVLLVAIVWICHFHAAYLKTRPITPNPKATALATADFHFLSSDAVVHR